jgi:hypothetical protein
VDRARQQQIVLPRERVFIKFEQPSHMNLI